MGRYLPSRRKNKKSHRQLTAREVTFCLASLDFFDFFWFVLRCQLYEASLAALQILVNMMNVDSHLMSANSHDLKQGDAT